MSIRDIFSDMQAQIGCQYVSDLPKYQKAVWFELCRIQPDFYTSEQMEDFSRYVFGKSYPVLVEAMRDMETASE